MRRRRITIVDDLLDVRLKMHDSGEVSEALLGDLFLPMNSQT
jgi:hypothetical protein